MKGVEWWFSHRRGWHLAEEKVKIDQWLDTFSATQLSDNGQQRKCIIELTRAIKRKIDVGLWIRGSEVVGLKLLST